MNIPSLCFEENAGSFEFTFHQHRSWLPDDMVSLPDGVRKENGYFELVQLATARGCTPRVRVGFYLDGYTNPLQNVGITDIDAAEAIYTNIVRAVGDHLADFLGHGWKTTYVIFKDGMSEFGSNYNQEKDPEFVEIHGFPVKFGFDYEYVAGALGELEIDED